MGSTIIAIIVIAAIAVGFLFLSLAITQIRKGRNIDSEIGTNRHMRERGITCVADDARRAHRSDDNCNDTIGCSSGGCSTCGEGEEKR